MPQERPDNSRERRLCVVVHARFPLGEPRVQRQAFAALEAGWKVDVVCLRHPGEAGAEIVDGANVHRLPVAHDRAAGPVGMAIEYFRFALLATAKVARLHLANRYDAVLVANPPDFLVAAGLLPRLLSARLLFDVHDLAPDLFAWRFGRSRTEGLARRLLVAQERLACRLSDRLLTVHSGCADELARRSVRDGRQIAIVMNTLDERLLPAEHPLERREWRDPPEVVYHGSLTELYGVHVLVDGVAKLASSRNVHLTVLGDGDALPDLRRQANDAGLGDVVSFSGRYLPIEETLRLVATCDVGVVPLLGLPINRFSLPSKLFEYVALGLPVVCGRTETVARHFSEDEITFFEPGDPDDLSRRLAQVLDDPAAAQEKAARARERYEAYRWDVSRRRFLDLLDAAVTSDARTARPTGPG